MLHNYLKKAISNLDSIISYIDEDIKDIKVANNQPIFDRNSLKLDLIKQFETNKSHIDEEMLKLVSSNKDKSLQDLIDDEASDLLSVLRLTLQKLKDINTHYARIVFSVNEFYSSLVELLIPKEKADYKSEVLKSQILRVQA